ncbi:hypothetical protein ACMYR3_07200 [Ampullimonas aquatilis]|uniref:hypothetical protein n=1 Tax=Ampullimonas aquatilis TaxID=1341549 RepID=UPI003C76CF45
MKSAAIGAHQGFSNGCANKIYQPQSLLNKGCAGIILEISLFSATHQSTFWCATAVHE